MDIDGSIRVEVQLLHRRLAFFFGKCKTNVLGELHELNSIDGSTLVLVELEEGLHDLFLVASKLLGAVSLALSKSLKVFDAIFAQGSECNAYRDIFGIELLDEVSDAFVLFLGVVGEAYSLEASRELRLGARIEFLDCAARHLFLVLSRDF